MRSLKTVFLILSGLLLAALVCLIVYAFSGPRGVSPRRVVPKGAPLCLAVMDLDARWPQVASSDLHKRLVRLEVLPERRSILQGFLGRETIAFYSARPGLCVASRLSPWQRPLELLWRLWSLATDEDWSRERYRGIELVRIEQRKESPAFTYFVYGDLGFLMIGAERSRMREMVDLLLDGGGGGGEPLAGYAPDHFISLYVRQDKLLDFDLREEYEEAKMRYGDRYLPPLWRAVEGINQWLVESGSPSLFEMYARVTSSVGEGTGTIAFLDIAGDNAVMDWRRIGRARSPAGGTGLARYASILPDDTIGVAAFSLYGLASGSGTLPVLVAPVEGDVRKAFDDKVEDILSSFDGSGALALGRPSLFSSLLPACAMFKLRSADDISGKINSLIDTMAGREVEIMIPGRTVTVESKAGHKRKSYGGFDYFVMRKSGPFVWSYAQLGDVLIVATHRNLIKSLVDGRDDPGSRLSSSRRFIRVVSPLSRRGSVQGFLNLKTLASHARTALDVYALTEALTSPLDSGESGALDTLEGVVGVLGCVGAVAWEGDAGSGRIVIPLNGMTKSETGMTNE